MFIHDQGLGVYSVRHTGETTDLFTGSFIDCYFYIQAAEQGLTE